MLNYMHVHIDLVRRSILNHYDVQWLMFHFSIKLLNNVLKQVRENWKMEMMNERSLFLGLTASDQTTLAFAHNEDLAKRGERFLWRSSRWKRGFSRWTNCRRFPKTSFTILVFKISTRRHWVSHSSSNSIIDWFSSAVTQFLTSESTIADISSGLGFKTLIRCDVCSSFDKKIT